MNLDPVCSSKYGNRPLLDLPALDVAGTGVGGSLMPSSLPTMAPPPLYRYNPQDYQQQAALTNAQAGGGFPAAAVPATIPQAAAAPVAPAAAATTVPVPVPVPGQAPPLFLPLPLPMDWPYASKLPGSLFAAPPGPTPYRNPQMFPYTFLHAAPFTMQHPPYPITDNAGQLVIGAGMTATVEGQQLARLYPGVLNPLPPGQQGFGPGGILGPAGRVPPPGLVPQDLQVAEQKPVERVFFEGVLTYGELSPVHGQDKNSTAYWKLPEFLRQELHATYGHVPATDVQVVAKNGEFHVYASPRRRQAAWAGAEAEGGEATVAAQDEDVPPDRRLIV